jgi:hypothetical protein
MAPGLAHYTDLGLAYVPNAVRQASRPRHHEKRIAGKDFHIGKFPRYGV